MSVPLRRRPGDHSTPARWRALLALGVVPSVWIAMAPLQPTAAVAAPVTSSSAIPSAAGPKSTVIVMLRKTGGTAQRSSARIAAVRSDESPLADSLRQAGAKVESTGKSIPYVVASVTKAQQAALARSSLVRAVEPDVAIPNPAPDVPSAEMSALPSKAQGRRTAKARSDVSPSICGSAASPEVDPEAITSAAINATGANSLGFDGSGVTVGYIAGSIDTTIPDFQRNSEYASAGSAAGSPVVADVNFEGDSAGTPGGDPAVESFIDASSIAAQGNTTYDLDNFISSTHSLPSPCDITVTGAAPGASVMGLDVFSNNNDTTTSNFVQAIDYAVTNGVKVLNESFGANPFPDTALDAIRIADDDAVAAGVTVVVSSGDAGVGNTLGSPATDSNLISVGATTTFRGYEQDSYGGINASVPNSSSGQWIDNNISALSSSGFAMSGGNTVDLVAPGDLNWAECSTSTQFSYCTDENGNPSPIQLTGGTSEAAPLTAAAAADVIQAYASTHGGDDPSPALIKAILMSTATDIDAPAEEQGAGLLDVLAAVKEATSLPGTSGTASGGVLVSPGQINITQAPDATSKGTTVSVTNESSSSESVDLSTRGLTHQVADQTGSFCLNPSSTTSSCGAPTANTFPIWSGLTEVYQEETFTVPTTTNPSRLEFSAGYPDTGQTSDLHVALYDPNGAYAGYSLPQGLADYAHVEVADPVAGTWTAVFFTEQNGATSGATGTSGTISWDATTDEFQPAGSISPSSLTIAPGATKTATFTATSPAASGDTAQSIVISTEGGGQTTIPVTVRTTVPTDANGGTFSGVLTGGNGRGNPANMDTYAFKVPSGLHDLEVSATFADTNDSVAGFLVDPEGDAVSSSSSESLDATLSKPVSTGGMDIYADSPEAGMWTLVLDWQPPVSGSEISEPFNGTIQYNQVNATSTLPQNPVELHAGEPSTFDVTVKNTGTSAQAYFVDPRTAGTANVTLPDQGGSDQNMALPLGSGLSYPYYLVPADTTGITASLTGSAPVTFDTGPFTGDPDLSPDAPAPTVTVSKGDDSAALSFSPSSGEVMPGVWYLNPSEIGPYGAAGAPSATASASFVAHTAPFDSTVTSSSGDLWTAYNGLSNGFTPVYVEPGKSATITVTITPTGTPGTAHSGVLHLDDTFLYNPLVGAMWSGDQLTSIPYSYTVYSPITITSLTGTYGTPLALTADGLADATPSYSVNQEGTAGCAISHATELVASHAGTCVVTASYGGTSSSPTTITFTRGNRAPLVITSTTGTYGRPLTLRTKGGSDHTPVTYAVTKRGSSHCSVTGATLAAKRAGTCTVTATMPSDSDYNAISSPPTRITIKAAATTTKLKASKRKVVVGHEHQEILTVTVSSRSGTPTGKVTIKGTKCHISLVKGRGTCRLSRKALKAGRYHLVAKYPGNVDFMRSTSKRTTLIVKR